MKHPPKPKSLPRKEAALRRFHVDPEKLARTPEITSVLKNSFGSVKSAVQAIRHSNETTAIEFLAVYDEIPAGDRDYISIEAICLKANVLPSALLGSLFMACKDMKGKESALIAVLEHPGVLKKTVEYAKTPGGDRDRKMLHEAVGFLPTPKGGSINVNLLNGAPQFPRNPERPAPEPDEENFAELFPSISPHLEEWSDNRRKLLSDGN